MSSGPSHHGLVDTIAFEDLGYAIRKDYYFPEEYVEHLHIRIDALRTAGCIRYKYAYTDFDYLSSTLATQRDKVIGTTLDSLDEYTFELMEEWSWFVDRFVSAGNLFDKLGYGHIPVEPKELHNYVVDHDGVIQAIDIETSFKIVQDRRLYNEYAENTRQLMKLELQRYVILRKIEKSGS